MWHLVDLPQGYHAVVGGKPGNLGLWQGKTFARAPNSTTNPPITRHDASALSDCLWNIARRWHLSREATWTEL
jgi:hypothetical protein